MSADAPEFGIELAPGVRVSQGDLRLQFSRSGGPGGQNVNKLNTKAELWVRLDAILGMSPAALDRLLKLAGRKVTAAGEIHLAAETSRRQEANRAAVMQRLRELILQAQIEPKKRRRTKPSRAARQRRLEAKRRRGEIKSRRRSIE